MTSAPVRPLVRAFVTLALIASLLIASPSPALAACEAEAYGPNWGNHCWVGYGYDTAANYITGIQRILKGLDLYGGSIDRLWGPLSDGATKNYQAARGLDADGIVGTQTWNEFKASDIFHCWFGSPYEYHRTWGESCGGSWRYSTNTSYWYIKKLNGTWQVHFSIYGPS